MINRSVFKVHILARPTFQLETSLQDIPLIRMDKAALQTRNKSRNALLTSETRAIPI
jgi:hypothetical protein